MMSAFLVADKTLHKILTQVAYEVRQSRWLREQCEKELNLDFTVSHWQTQLGQKMWELNQLSLGYRYGDEKVALTYRFQPFPCTPVQAFKALQCWLYQCMEGEIPELSRLYLFFDTVVAPAWAEAIIMRSQEYDQAEWG
jgi:hypothetical protein